MVHGSPTNAVANDASLPIMNGKVAYQENQAANAIRQYI
jgi:hypothetical protein